MNDGRMLPNEDSTVPEDPATLPASPISIADLVSLGVPVHWTEAVALVEEVCAVLSEDMPAAAAAPPPPDLFFTAQGNVMVRRGAPRTDDIDTVARLLHSLLDPQATPLPLRLFVTESIGSGKYPTFKAYGDALAYYSRPERTELLRSLYLRCLQAPAIPVALPEEPDAAEPPPEEDEERGAANRRRRMLVLALGTAAVMLLAAVIVLSGGGATTSAMQTVRSVAEQAAATVVNLIPGASEAPPPDVPVEAGTTSSERPRGTGRARAASPEPSGVAPLPEEALPELPPIAVNLPRFEGDLARAPEPAGRASEASPGGDATAAAPVFTEDPTIYSQASRDVQPPVMYEPKLPPVAAAEDGLPGTNTMELLIDERGAVVQVRLASRPRRATDMMLLSPAKTWKFHPAMRNGQPVKYRLRMSWTVTPP